MEKEAVEKHKTFEGSWHYEIDLPKWINHILYWEEQSVKINTTNLRAKNKGWKGEKPQCIRFIVFQVLAQGQALIVWDKQQAWDVRKQLRRQNLR